MIVRKKVLVIKLLSGLVYHVPIKRYINSCMMQFIEALFWYTGSSPLHVETHIFTHVIMADLPLHRIGEDNLLPNGCAKEVFCAQVIQSETFALDQKFNQDKNSTVGYHVKLGLYHIKFNRGKKKQTQQTVDSLYPLNIV